MESLTKWLTDILQGPPVNSALRERVALAQERAQMLEERNKDFERTNAELRREVVELKRQIEEHVSMPDEEQPMVVHNCYCFGGDTTKLYCTACYDSKGKKSLMANMRHMGLKCGVCGNHILG
jgi:hypothetical protein